MKQIKQKALLFSSIILIMGCVQDTSKLTTALTDGVEAGVKTSMDKNSSEEGINLKKSLISGVQVGLKSALDDNSSKESNNSSGNMTTQVIDGVAEYLQDDKDKKK